jgi:hypothetical protein
VDALAVEHAGRGVVFLKSHGVSLDNRDARRNAATPGLHGAAGRD